MNTALQTALKASVYAVLSLMLVLAFVFAGGTEFSLWLAVCAAVVSVLVVQRSDRGRSARRLVTFFFWLAAGHAVFGYWAAGNSTDVIWIASNSEQMFRRALFVIAATLLVAAFTYDVTPRFPSAWAQRFGRQVRVSEEKLIRAARGLVMLGALCIAYLVVAVGFMPFLAANPSTERYILANLGPAYSGYDWLRLRGLELLGCSLPLVLFSGVNYRRKLDLLIGVLGILAILVTLQRGTLIDRKSVV